MFGLTNREQVIKNPQASELQHKRRYFSYKRRGERKPPKSQETLRRLQLGQHTLRGVADALELTSPGAWRAIAGIEHTASRITQGIGAEGSNSTGHDGHTRLSQEGILSFNNDLGVLSREDQASKLTPRETQHLIKSATELLLEMRYPKNRVESSRTRLTHRLLSDPVANFLTKWNKPFSVCAGSALYAWEETNNILNFANVSPLLIAGGGLTALVVGRYTATRLIHRYENRVSQTYAEASAAAESHGDHHPMFQPLFTLLNVARHHSLPEGYIKKTFHKMAEDLDALYLYKDSPLLATALTTVFREVQNTMTHDLKEFSPRKSSKLLLANALNGVVENFFINGLGWQLAYNVTKLPDLNIPLVAGCTLASALAMPSTRELLARAEDTCVRKWETTVEWSKALSGRLNAFVHDFPKKITPVKRVLFNGFLEWGAPFALGTLLLPDEISTPAPALLTNTTEPLNPLLKTEDTSQGLERMVNGS
ncbi:MAG: hypothetical protein WCP97_04570 [bacterium]